MSSNDSFIDEVSEEVRRDRLFLMAKRFGWIAVVAVLAIVGGASVVEWKKAQARQDAQALGDSIYSALSTESSLSRATALQSAVSEGEARAITLLLAASELAQTDVNGAGALLEEVAAMSDIRPLYSDLATLKLTMLADYPLLSDAKIKRLAPLMTPGAPFRLLATELTATVHIERGEDSEALVLLEQLADDAESSPAQRQRAGQLIVALGGLPE